MDINWKLFKDTLLKHPDVELQFRYGDNELVDADYHITEIKQAPVTSVDCGGVLNTWTEIIVQLWEPEGEAAEKAMKVSKALSIIKTVENMLTLDETAMVKIEFGNSAFETRQMVPHALIEDTGSLTVDLRADTVQCKAQTRGGTCGTEKRKAELVNLAAAPGTCCTAGGSCS